MVDRRRTYALAIAASALVVGVGAARPTPAPSPSPSPTSSPTATQSDGTLQILTYRGYAEYGGTSPKVNWTGAFEKETGCRIAKLDTVQTSEEMAEKVTQRPYDVISAGPVLAADLIAKKQVQAIDPAKVAGYDDIDERFRDMSTVSGKVYGVPYLWGYHEFIYDSGRVEGGDLRQVFDSERVALRDTPLTIADAAMAGGSADEPYELTEKQLDETMTMLERNKDRVYWRNPIDLVKGFATGSLDYAQATPYYRMLLQKAGKPIEAVRTRETTGWVDSWMLGANVPDTTCAYRWLNWVTAPDAQRDAAAWVGLAPANDKACKGRARQMCEAYGVGEDKKLDHVVFAVRPPACGECTDYDAWTERWRELAE
ncbi:extracellular solute-binding protein [Nonomuraea diastatica]|uniref:Extracellular solute-binding protein n=1 Tax=Nonomuraea diastatica TaxID=1848329 RepID=A0A4V2YCL5_9ACTN|nr:extracellular solute-binding protein [Nonomuraea diastatica]